MQYAALRMRLTPVPPPAHPSVLRKLGSAGELPLASDAPKAPCAPVPRVWTIPFLWESCLTLHRHVPALDDKQVSEQIPDPFAHQCQYRDREHRQDKPEPLPVAGR
jgi:hypothetical protein